MKSRVGNKQKKTAGFTLVELLIVIVVIAILATISIVTYNGIQERAKDTERKSDIASIGKAMQLWTISTGKPFEQLTTGFGGGNAAGYFTSSYSGNPSIKTALVNSGFLSDNINEESGYRYMVARCTNASDNRRVIMARLSNPPSQTVSQQIAGSGCNNAYINSFASSSYNMNYAIVVGG